ncbi:MAG TPA: low molecular weight protein arginine phosphatase [Bacillales bacterium]|nr:low molecular weight protein arginine phosphatase [Bacillales bacterium]
MKNILFICTGNTCRSPMAEAVLRAKAGDRFDVRSAGVFAASGHPAAQAASQVLSSQGIEMNHRSTMLNEELIEWADVILTMTQNHKSVVLQQFPQSVGKVYMLKEYADDDSKAKEIWERLDACYAELETERALNHGEEVHRLEKEIRSLEESLPSYDISDPYGGNVEEYQAVYEELDGWLERLIKKEEAGD